MQPVAATCNTGQICSSFTLCNLLLQLATRVRFVLVSPCATCCCNLQHGSDLFQFHLMQPVAATCNTGQICFSFTLCNLLLQLATRVRFVPVSPYATCCCNLQHGSNLFQFHLMQPVAATCNTGKICLSFTLCNRVTCLQYIISF